MSTDFNETDMTGVKGVIDGISKPLTTVSKMSGKKHKHLLSFWAVINGVHSSCFIRLHNHFRAYLCWSIMNNM